MTLRTAEAPRAVMPRLGFLGAGWIGRNRLEALAGSGAGAVVAIADPLPERAAAAAAAAEDAVLCASLESLLEHELDGIVIATPSALHAEQCVQALERGLAVFCQKPLGRTAAETQRVIDAAQRADRLLSVDLSYRHATALQAVRQAVLDGRIGTCHAADMVFHNAWGPDSAWARDATLSGGGCVIDLGIHLVDLALWTLDFPRVRHVSCHRYERGRKLEPADTACEDYAVATIELDGGAVVRIACSWEFNAGRDAIIGAAFHGTDGSAVMHNVNGSFYDFAASFCERATAHPLATPPDDWGGRALIEWSRRVGASARFDPAVERVVDVAAVLDRMLGR
jgi:predicted dehydrogenase